MDVDLDVDLDLDVLRRRRLPPSAAANIFFSTSATSCRDAATRCSNASENSNASKDGGKNAMVGLNRGPKLIANLWRYM